MIVRAFGKAGAAVLRRENSITLAMMCLLVPISAVCAQRSLDPAKEITQYTQNTWSTSAGLPHNSILAIAQTQDGYLWLGTEEGLARFDGVRFVVFDTHNTPALGSNHISALLADTKQNLWIGTRGGGLTVFRAGTFKTYTTRDGLTNDAILALKEDDQGSLWIGTNGGGLNRFQNGKFSAYTTKDGLPSDSVFAIATAHDGIVWIGTQAGLASLKQNQLTLYKANPEVRDTFIRCLYIGRTGDLWIGTNDSGLSRFSAGHFVHYTTRNGMSSNSIWCLYEDPSGTLWVGTYDGGITRFRDGSFENYRSKDGLSGDTVFSLFGDVEGSLWIGTGGAGVIQLRDGLITPITVREGLSSNVALPVFQDHAGVIWVGTNGGGINRIEGGHITKYTVREGLSDNVVFSIAEDKQESLWIATRKGLNRLRNGHLTSFDKNANPPRVAVWCLYRDRDGNMWAGSRDGLSRFDGTRFMTYTKKDGLASNDVVSIYQDPRGTLWIGTGEGLSEFRADEFRSYTTRDGLSSNSVWTMTGDAEGALWIGTGAGLDRFLNGKFTAYTVHQGLFDDEPIGMLNDGLGNLWFSSNKGIFRVSISELDAYAAGRLSSIHSLSYGTSDGLKSDECNGGFQPAAWRAKNGTLLFPTMKGLVMVDPGKLQDSPKPPEVLIESVNIDGREFDIRSSTTAKPGEGKLEFTFTGLSLMSSERIEFRYKLDGFDEDWVNAEQRRSAYYTNIAPGTYRFVVTARRPGGIWSSREAVIEVALLPHFYQTRWFAGSCALVFFGLCATTYWLRVRQLRKNEIRLVSLIDERTQALQEQVHAKESALSELAEAQQSLIELSRRSGMAEIATGVLHNVGNVLNSVNVTAAVISEKVKESRLGHLSTGVKMLTDHSQDLDSFLRDNERGQKLLPYLTKLCGHLKREQDQILVEIESLTGHIDHIKEIVATQQDYAKASILTEIVAVPKTVEQAIKMVQTGLNRHHVEVLRQIENVGEISIAKHKLLEILVNLIRNAKEAVVQFDGPKREVRICVKRHLPDRIRIEVHDTGVGLSEENITRIFSHGFTTKKHGHGFGLHSAALSAKKMGGSLWAESAGPGLGSTFILEIPTMVNTGTTEVSAEETLDPVLSG